MEGNTAVRLLKPYKGINAGEIAGWPHAEAQDLIAQGFAESLTPPVPATPAETRARDKQELDEFQRDAAEPMPEKAETEPPVDKMVRGAEKKKR